MEVVVLRAFPSFRWKTGDEYYGGWKGDLVDYPYEVACFLIKRKFVVSHYDFLQAGGSLNDGG